MRKLFDRGLQLRSVNSGARTATFVASTDTIDRFGEVVDQATWKTAEYDRNPVILWGHNSRDLHIGKGNARLVNGQLEIVITFASEAANPLAEQVWRGVCEGIVKAVSVGFYPGRTEREQRNGRTVSVLYDCTLIEVSVVSIGANQDALLKNLADMPAADGRRMACRKPAKAAQDFADIVTSRYRQSSGLRLVKPVKDRFCRRPRKGRRPNGAEFANSINRRWLAHDDDPEAA